MQLGFLTDGAAADVAFAAQEGFDCLELALFGDTPLFDNPTPFAQALKEHAVPLAAVSLFGQDYFDMLTGEERLKRLDKVIALTATLGAPVVVFGTGASAPSPRAAIEKLYGRLTQAKERGLTPAFYNCHWENVIDRPEAWVQVMDAFPGVGIKFDPSHPIQQGRDWKAELHAAGPHLVHAHAKDVLSAGGTFVTDPNPGLGEIRWESFFGMLYHHGYDGAVCIEPHSALYTGPRRYEFLRLSARYLRRFLV